MGRKKFFRSLLAPARYKDAHIVLHRGGHILEYCPDHPACNARGMVLQHRLVMECKLGRFLTGQEVVHHIDNDKTNNHEDNLLLFPNQKAHVLYHQRKRAKKYDPKIVQMVREAANDPKRTVASLPLSSTTVLTICKENGIKWINACEVYLNQGEVLGILQTHSRKEAVEILGVNLQTLWNKFPEEMRMTASRKLLKWDAIPAGSGRRND